MWPLAIKSMLADRGKLATSLLGVAFAVVLVNLQGGLLLGLIEKTSLLVDCGQADIWVGHRHTHNVDVGSLIPERWIQRIRGLEGVERAEPYLVMYSEARVGDGRFEPVIVVGCEQASLLGNAWAMAEGNAAAVRQPHGILVDRYDAEKLGHCRVGDVLEINGRRARVVGLTDGIVGFSTNPYVFTTLERARQEYVPGLAPEYCSFFLVKARPGQDVPELVDRIRQQVPQLDVYDRATYSRMCMHYWLTRTGIGISFGLAAFLGLLVGLAVVGQTLYASVTQRLREFATLKALGAADGCVGRFVLAQAVGNAVLGSAVGLLLALAIALSATSPRAPIHCNGWIAAGSIVLITVVCLLAAWLPYWRVRRIDPAAVLRGP